MDYKHIYNSIIQNRMSKPISNETIYNEVHHIKPKCFFDKKTSNNIINNKDNLIRLTAREHFICHCLLVKMYKKGTRKWFQMCEAVNIMKGKHNRYINSKLYENIKINYWLEKTKLNEDKTLKQINKICNFIDKYSKTPNKRSVNKEEKSLGIKLHQIKYNKNHKSKGIFSESFQKLIVKRGYSNLFNIESNESKTLNIINEICDFIDKYNKLPSRLSNHKLESFYGRKIKNIKYSKQKKGTGIFHKSYQDLVKYRSYSDLFDV